MLPGVKASDLENVNVDDKAIAHMEAIILSMTPYERENPSVLNASRKKRIAAGCGLQVVDVNRLLKQYEAMQQMMKMVSGKGMKKMRKKMGGMGGFPGIPGF
jgi:signal recognition particle subunit SRP54